MKYTKNEAAKELDRVVTDILSNTEPEHWLTLMEEMTELVRKHAPNKYGLSPASSVKNHVRAMNEKLAELEAKMKQDPFGTIGTIYGTVPYPDMLEYKVGTSGVGSDDTPF